MTANPQTGRPRADHSRLRDARIGEPAGPPSDPQSSVPQPASVSSKDHGTRGSARGHGAHAATPDDREWPDEGSLAAWQERAQRIGEAAAPHLYDLIDDLSGSVAAILCTGDGLNLCAVGFDEDQVGRFAALSSSLHSVSHAAADALPDSATPGELEVVSVVAKGAQLLYVSFDHRDLGGLILGAAAGEATLGELLFESRRTAAALRDALADL